MVFDLVDGPVHAAGALAEAADEPSGSLCAAGDQEHPPVIENHPVM